MTKQTIDTGSGNDKISIDRSNGVLNQYDITTGSGNDVVDLQIDGAYRTERPNSFMRTFFGAPAYKIYGDQGEVYNLTDFDPNKDKLLINGAQSSL